MSAKTVRMPIVMKLPNRAISDALKKVERDCGGTIRSQKARIAALEKDLADQQKAADEAIAEWRKEHEKVRDALRPFSTDTKETMLAVLVRVCNRATNYDGLGARATSAERDAATWKSRYEAAEAQRIAEREAFEERIENAHACGVDGQAVKDRHRALVDGVKALAALADKA